VNQASLSGNEDEAIADYNTITGRIDADLKQAGYETVWLVIPACSLGAPHRRDRVWIVANATKSGINGISRDDKQQEGVDEVRSNEFDRSYKSITTDTSQQGLQGEQSREPIRLSGQCDRKWCYERPNWTENWYEVATRFCRVDDGVPNRVERLKSLGNAIVPQAAYEIIKAIKEADGDR
jgi:DNA (cytosine-5)-methyltransferase 1